MFCFWDSRYEYLLHCFLENKDDVDCIMRILRLICLFEGGGDGQGERERESLKHTWCWVQSQWSRGLISWPWVHHVSRNQESRHSTEYAIQELPLIFFMLSQVPYVFLESIFYPNQEFVLSFSQQYIPVRTQSTMKQMKPNICNCPYFYCDLEKGCCFKEMYHVPKGMWWNEGCLFELRAVHHLK